MAVSKKEILLWVVLILIILVLIFLFIFFSSQTLDGLTPERITVIDINRLSIPLENFKFKFGLYPPSKIKLCKSSAEYGQDPFDKESLMYLWRIWPRLEKDIDWSGGIEKNPGPWVLEGDQCLVFFLGGIPSEKGCTGFSTNSRNPSLREGDRVTFYDFSEFQLFKRDPKSPFWSFADAFANSSPYLYFSSGLKRNGYDDTHEVLGVKPYFFLEGETKKYHNPHSFQIISAGKTGKFGPGGFWTNEKAANLAGTDGADDLTNFHSGPLGLSVRR